MKKIRIYDDGSSEIYDTIKEACDAISHYDWSYLLQQDEDQEEDYLDSLTDIPDGLYDCKTAKELQEFLNGWIEEMSYNWVGNVTPFEIDTRVFVQEMNG